MAVSSSGLSVQSCNRANRSDWQMRVLGEPQGLQAPIVDHLSEPTWCRGIDGGELAIPIFMPSTPSIRPWQHRTGPG